LQDKLNKVVDS